MSKNAFLEKYKKEHANELRYLSIIAHLVVEKNEAIIDLPKCSITPDGDSAFIIILFNLACSRSSDMEEKLWQNGEDKKKILQTLKEYGLDNKEQGTTLVEKYTYSNDHLTQAVYSVKLLDITKISPLTKDTPYYQSGKCTEIVTGRQAKFELEHSTPPQIITNITKGTLPELPESAKKLLAAAKYLQHNAPVISPLHAPTKKFTQQLKPNYVGEPDMTKLTKQPKPFYISQPNNTLAAKFTKQPKPFYIRQPSDDASQSNTDYKRHDGTFLQRFATVNGASKASSLVQSQNHAITK